MTEKLFEVRREEKITQRRFMVWVVEPQNNGKNTEHSCRTRAITTLLSRQPSDEYRFIFPDKKSAYTLRKAGSRWSLSTDTGEPILKDASVPYAVKTLLSQQSNGEDRFFISIPEIKGGGE